MVAIKINVHYRILEAELSEDCAYVFLRLQTWRNSSTHTSLPNVGFTPDTNGTLISSYFVYKGAGESGNPLILFVHGNIWRNVVRFIRRYLL